MFELFTPAKLGQHRLFFTCGWTFVIFSAFWYMIGEFPYYQAVQFPDPQRSACLQASSTTPMAYGSSQPVHWINQVCMANFQRSRIASYVLHDQKSHSLLQWRSGSLAIP